LYDADKVLPMLFINMTFVENLFDLFPVLVQGIRNLQKQICILTLISICLFNFVADY